MVENDFCHNYQSFQRQVRASRSVVKGFVLYCASALATDIQLCSRKLQASAFTFFRFSEGSLR
ncbi:hypothetical protein FKX98_01505 [Bifidobacterium breve]|nr:hypothetical protein [Bifidobacterium breve]